MFTWAEQIFSRKRAPQEATNKSDWYLACQKMAEAGGVNLLTNLLVEFQDKCKLDENKIDDGYDQKMYTLSWGLQGGTNIWTQRHLYSRGVRICASRSKVWVECTTHYGWIEIDESTDYQVLRNKILKELKTEREGSRQSVPCALNDELRFMVLYARHKAGLFRNYKEEAKRTVEELRAAEDNW